MAEFRPAPRPVAVLATYPIAGSLPIPPRTSVAWQMERIGTAGSDAASAVAVDRSGTAAGCLDEGLPAPRWDFAGAEMAACGVPRWLRQIDGGFLGGKKFYSTPKERRVTS